jgi:hypothetical protein
MPTTRPNAARMPWLEAVALYGEPALKAGHSHQRVSNWRRDGVPGQVLIGLERERRNKELATNRTGVLADAARALVSVPPPVLAMLERIQRVWELSEKGHAIGWRVLDTIIATLMDHHERPSQG